MFYILFFFLIVFQIGCVFKTHNTFMKTIHISSVPQPHLTSGYRTDSTGLETSLMPISSQFPSLTRGYRCFDF